MFDEFGKGRDQVTPAGQIARLDPGQGPREPATDGDMDVCVHPSGKQAGTAAFSASSRPSASLLLASQLSLLQALS
jgi:hypothetical protein